MKWLLDYDPAMGQKKGITGGIMNRDEERWEDFFRMDWHSSGHVYVEGTVEGWRINGLIQFAGYVMKRKGWAEWDTREEAVEEAKSLAYHLQNHKSMDVEYFDDPKDSTLHGALK